MIDGNTRDGRHALRRRRLPVFAPRRSQRPLRQRLAEPHASPGSPGTTMSYANAVHRLPSARDHRAVPPAAPAVRGRSRQRKPRFDRARLEIPRRRLLARTALFYEMKKSNVILRETNGFNVSNGATRHRGFEYEARLDARALEPRRSMARSRATNMRSRAPSRVARPSSAATTSTPRRATCIRWHSTCRLGEADAWRLGVDDRLRRQVLPGCRQHRDLSRAYCGQRAHRLEPGKDLADDAAGRQPFRHAIRGSRRLRFRQLPLFPGARPRGVPVRGLRPQLRGTTWPGSSTSSPDCSRWDSSSTASRPAETPSGCMSSWCSSRFPFVGAAGLLRRGNPSRAAEIAHQPARHARHPHHARSGRQPAQVRK